MTTMSRKSDSAARRDAPKRNVKAASRSVGRAESPAVDLGRTARRLRESQDLTLADVARRANISSAMLSRLETGRVSPSLETIVALAQALGVTASLLMQRVGADEAASRAGRRASDARDQIPGRRSAEARTQAEGCVAGRSGGRSRR